MPLANPFCNPESFDEGGNNCCEPCEVVPPAPAPPPPCKPKPEPCCPDGQIPAPIVCSHCYFDAFKARYPDLACWGDEALCGALEKAECYTRGFFDLCLREVAIVAAAAHILEVQNVAATESGSRFAAASKGVVSRPSGGSDPLNDWWKRTIYGEEYLQAVNRDCTIDFVVI